MGRPARSLHDAGNHRAVERRSPRQAARRGGGLTIPASPAGERETTAALTPLLGARSLYGALADGQECRTLCAVIRTSSPRDVVPQRGTYLITTRRYAEVAAFSRDQVNVVPSTQI